VQRPPALLASCRIGCCGTIELHAALNARTLTRGGQNFCHERVRELRRRRRKRPDERPHDVVIASSPPRCRRGVRFGWQRTLLTTTAASSYRRHVPLINSTKICAELAFRVKASVFRSPPFLGCSDGGGRSSGRSSERSSEWSSGRYRRLDAVVITRSLHCAPRRSASTPLPDHRAAAHSNEREWSANLLTRRCCRERRRRCRRRRASSRRVEEWTDEKLRRECVHNNLRRRRGAERRWLLLRTRG
jgi:hypothetical protein